ncbi:ATP-binding protein [Hydrogenoanaerobacterium sp.]|uniref:sensor histidine kinase n=1 Tax=Hydrogenoanaerobacterium sp. TaxID=2953763 RepID=UPI0028985DFF|nr:ATP-binding protein [Hydrogenoanaerobacterium sp.]
MKKHIIIRCIFLCVAVVLLSGLASAAILQYNKEQSIVRNMKDILTAISLQEETSTLDYDKLAKVYTKLSFDYRITVMNKVGEVLGDSHFDFATMPNHADRPEIKQAIAAGTGYEKRSSETFGRPMLYVAMRDGDIIYRIAAPVDTINATFLDLLPALLAGLLLALIISPVLASSTAKSITKPLSSVADSLKTLDSDDYAIKLVLPEFDELQPIASTINSLTQHISENMRELSHQKEKTDYLLNNMEDGLILVDHNMRVLQINEAAQKFLGESKSVEGKNLLVLTHQLKLIDAVQNAVEGGTSSLFDLSGNQPVGMILSVHVTAIQSGWMAQGKANGAVILITDVTQERKAEKMRSEFVANASHELKTPITSIGGFAELLAAGVVKEPDKVQDYLVRIKNETQRMAMLIEDILKLSCLENSEESEQNLEPVNLKEVIEEVVENIQPQITARGVQVMVDAQDITVQAVPDEMEALVQNLLDNAVKYNRDGGSVTVTLETHGGAAYLSVTDTGIGIPYEDQPRIFERFYRVDKGRSRKVGGTGLGLSIVKHVAGKYGGEISLKSVEGKGTTVAVSIPQ